jgi:hypothetical protein
MERLNGEIRDRERVMRGLEKKDTPILTGYQLFHNYILPHMALEDKTPAEAAGIKVKGQDKWLTIIQVMEQYPSAIHPSFSRTRLYQTVCGSDLKLAHQTQT